MEIVGFWDGTSVYKDGEQSRVTRMVGDVGRNVYTRMRGAVERSGDVWGVAFKRIICS